MRNSNQRIIEPITKTQIYATERKYTPGGGCFIDLMTVPFLGSLGLEAEFFKEFASHITEPLKDAHAVNIQDETVFVFGVSFNLATEPSVRKV